MAMKNPMPSSPGTIDTTYGPSNSIWQNCPWTDYREDPSKGQTTWLTGKDIGTALMSSAYAGPLGRVIGYGYAGAQINDGQLEGGAVKLSSDGDNEGCMFMESAAGAYRFVTTSTLALNRRMWFEASVYRSSIATAHGEFFVGLMAPTLASGIPAAAQPITTTDDTLMTAGDLFGFHSNGATGTRGGPTEVANAFVLASGTVNYPTNLTTMMATTGNTVLAANTVVKIGWVYDPSAATKIITKATARQTAGNKQAAIIRFFVNGVEHPAFLSSSDVANATATQAFPTSFMTPCFAWMNQSSFSSDYGGFRWLRCAQEILGP
jgi:hypothetical protein